MNIERFALNQVTDGVLLLQRQHNTILVEFANQSFFRILKANCSVLALDLSKIFLQFQLLKESIHRCLDSGTTIEDLNLDIFNSIGVKLEVFCTLTAYDRNFCCMVIRRVPTRVIENVRMLEIYQQICGIGSVAEYHKEMEDAKFVWLTAGTVRRWKLSSEKEWIGKFALRDIGLEAEMVKGWIQNFPNPTQNQRNVFYSEIKLPILNEKHLLKCNIQYLEQSEDGFPLYLLWSEEFTESIGDYVDQREYDESREVYKLLNVFFQNSEVNMATIDLIDDDTDCKYVLANPALLKCYQRTSENLIGRPLLKDGIAPSIVVRKLIECLRKCEQVGHPIMEECLHPIRKLLFLSNVIQISKNRFSVITQDITQRREMEEQLKRQGEELEATVKARTQQLEEALQVKNRFLAMISHEIRTPLNGIMGAISLLNDTKLTTDQIQTLNIGEVCCQQLIRVTSDILDFAKLEAKKLTLEYQPFNLHSTVEDALEICSFDAQKKKLELISDIDVDVPESIVGDCIRLRQILVNLLSNACKFSENSPIYLKVTIVDAKYDVMEIQFSVEDEGIGIPEELKAKIFQPFTQGDLSATRKYGGTGLGLVICKQICDLMGGRIWFESQVDKGSKFFFTIPFHPNPVSSMTAPIVTDKKVLIVDRSEATVRSLKKIFQLWNIHCSSVLSNDMEDNHFDIAIVDCKDIGLVDQISQLGCAIVIMGYPSQLQETITAKCPNSDFSVLKKPVRRSALKNLLAELSVRKELPLPTSFSPKNHSVTVLTTNSHKSVSILVAEDNLMNQQVIKRLLENLGYTQVDVVDNGKMAVDLVERKHFDIVLMDIMMPELSGIEATHIIKNKMKLEESPTIIAVTADVQMENPEMLYSLGFDDIVTKPISKQKLQNALERNLPQFPHT